MRCFICNFNAEETPGTDNHVFVDPLTEKEICQACYDAAHEAILDFEDEGGLVEPSSDSGAAVS
jgi:hypothetical protein